MSDLKSLVEQRNDLVQKMKDLTATVETEQRAFTDEEAATFQEHEDKVKALDATIAAQERARALEMTENSKKEEKKVEENREALEARAFENYIRGIVEERADVNMSKGDNGAVIPTTIASKIIEKVHEISPLYRMATKYNVKGTLEIPYYPAYDSTSQTYPDVAMSYASEFSELESSSGKFGSIQLTGFLAGALTKVSKSLVNNSQFNIVDFVVNNMANEIARWLENELLHGTSSPSQKVTGLIAGVTQSVTAAATGAVTADELIELQDQIPDAFQAKACWIMSRATRTAIRKLKNGQGIYLLNTDLTTPFGYSLLGKPVYVSENMEDMAASKAAIVYGDMSGLAVKLSEEMNIEVLREKFATQHAIGVVGWMEVDAKVENAQKVAKLVMHAS